MDKWDNKPSRDHRKQHHRENPSFSSTLLDVIYRSIDEGQTEEKEDQLIFYRETMRKQKQSTLLGGEGEKLNLRRSRKVENWMERRPSEKVVMGRNSLTEFERRTRSNSNTLSMYSSSSSSESSSAGGFSSSESESFYGVHRPKPIRTSVSEKTNLDALHGFRNHSAQTQKPKHENGFGKTKSKALRILYGDLKKAKQPISPGARLASFLNSLFTSGGNAKKAKVLFEQNPFIKIRPCGHKNLHEGEEELVATLAATSAMQKSYGKNSSEELRLHVMQESRRVEELARDLLKNYQKKNEVDFDMQFEEEEDDDDAASCSSSDLFELDNLSAIGIERYREELPVYETTHFNTNRAIANGFIL
ncbi:hypothetical protein SESBI_29050 [Sesbania bispinosa]|nr:hypothetical protein SESBI_29050 [Sesbania bispinosa]